MTPISLTACLDTIGWSVRHLADQLSCDPKLAQRWVNGTAKVPAPVAAWLLDLAHCHERHPAPTAWRTRATRPAAPADPAAPAPP